MGTQGTVTPLLSRVEAKDTIAANVAVINIAVVDALLSSNVSLENTFLSNAGANYLYANNLTSNAFTASQAEILGNLIVRGNLVTVQEVTVQDPVVIIGNGSTATRIGVLAAPPSGNAALVWNSTAKEFELFTTLDGGTTGTVTPLQYANVRTGDLTASNAVVASLQTGNALIATAQAPDEYLTGSAATDVTIRGSGGSVAIGTQYAALRVSGNVVSMVDAIANSVQTSHIVAGEFTSNQFAWNANGGLMTLSANTLTVGSIVGNVPASNVSGSLVNAALPTTQLTGTLQQSSFPATIAANIIGNLVATNVVAQTVIADVLSGNLAASNVYGSLVNATLPASQLTGTLQQSNFPARVAIDIAGNLTGAYVNANIPAGNVIGALTNATLPASQLTGTLQQSNFPKSVSVDVYGNVISTGNVVANVVVANVVVANSVSALSSVVTVNNDTTITGNVNIGVGRVLAFGYTVQNNILCLYGETPGNLDPNATYGTYGFGVNPFVLRYNSMYNHQWFAGSTSLAYLDSFGNLSVTRALLAPNAYSEFHGNVTSTGNVVANNITANLVRAAQFSGNVFAANVYGSLTNATLPASQLTGTIQPTNLPATINADIFGNLSGAYVNAVVPAGNVFGALTNATLPATNLTGTLQQSNFPKTVSADILGNLNGAYVNANIPAGNVYGSLTNATLPASQLTGTIQPSNLPPTINADIFGNIVAANVTSQTVYSSQFIGNVFASNVFGSLINATLPASQLTGTIQSSNLPPTINADIYGNVSATGNLVANNVVANVLAANIAVSNIYPYKQPFVYIRGNISTALGQGNYLYTNDQYDYNHGIGQRSDLDFGLGGAGPIIFGFSGGSLGIGPSTAYVPTARWTSNSFLVHGDIVANNITAGNVVHAAQFSGNVFASNVFGSLTNATLPASQLTGTIQPSNLPPTINADIFGNIVAANVTSQTVYSAQFIGNVFAANVFGSLANATLPASQLTGTIQPTNIPPTINADLYGNVSANVVASNTVRIANVLVFGGLPVKNNLLCLYANDSDAYNPNSTNIYGFGVNGGLLRYNSSAFAGHQWFSNNFRLAALDYLGNFTATANLGGAFVNANVPAGNVLGTLTRATVPTTQLTGTISQTNLPATIYADIFGNVTATGNVNAAAFNGNTFAANVYGALINATVPTSQLTGTIQSTNLPPTIYADIYGNVSATAVTSLNTTSKNLTVTNVYAQSGAPYSAVNLLSNVLVTPNQQIWFSGSGHGLMLLSDLDFGLGGAGPAIFGFSGGSLGTTITGSSAGYIPTARWTYNSFLVHGNVVANNITASNLVQAAQFSGNVFAANVYGALTNATLPASQLTGTILPTNMPSTIHADIFGNLVGSQVTSNSLTTDALIANSSNVSIFGSFLTNNVVSLRTSNASLTVSNVVLSNGTLVFGDSRGAYVRGLPGFLSTVSFLAQLDAVYLDLDASELATTWPSASSTYAVTSGNVTSVVESGFQYATLDQTANVSVLPLTLPASTGFVFAMACRLQSTSTGSGSVFGLARFGSATEYLSLTAQYLGTTQNSFVVTSTTTFGGTTLTASTPANTGWITIEFSWQPTTWALYINGAGTQQSHASTSDVTCIVASVGPGSGSPQTDSYFDLRFSGLASGNPDPGSLNAALVAEYSLSAQSDRVMLADAYANYPTLIVDSARVGINRVPVPSYALDVQGNARVRGNLVASQVSAVYLYGNGAFLTGLSGAQLPHTIAVDVLGNVTASGNVNAAAFNGNTYAANVYGALINATLPTTQLTGTILSTNLPPTINADINGNVSATNVTTGNLAVANVTGGQINFLYSTITLPLNLGYYIYTKGPFDRNHGIGHRTDLGLNLGGEGPIIFGNGGGALGIGPSSSYYPVARWTQNAFVVNGNVVSNNLVLSNSITSNILSNAAITLYSNGANTVLIGTEYSKNFGLSFSASPFGKHRFYSGTSPIGTFEINNQYAAPTIRLYSYNQANPTGMLWNDGSLLYLVVSNANDPDGLPNGYRPLQVQMSTGRLGLAGCTAPVYPVDVGGTLRAQSVISDVTGNVTSINTTSKNLTVTNVYAQSGAPYSAVNLLSNVLVTPNQEIWFSGSGHGLMLLSDLDFGLGGAGPAIFGFSGGSLGTTITGSSAGYIPTARWTYDSFLVHGNVVANSIIASNLVQAAQFSGNVYAANVFGSLVNATLPTTQLTGTILSTNLPPTINADIFGNVTATGNLVANNLVASNLVQAEQFSGNVYAANVYGSLVNATLPTTQLTGTIQPTNLPPTINADIFGNVTATGNLVANNFVASNVVQSAAINTGPVTCTTINTQNNSINAGTGAITAGPITSTTINTQNNSINAGTGAIFAGPITSTTINTQNNSINAGSGAIFAGTISSGPVTCTTINTQNNSINAGSGAITAGPVTCTTINTQNNRINNVYLSNSAQIYDNVQYLNTIVPETQLNQTGDYRNFLEIHDVGVYVEITCKIAANDMINSQKFMASGVAGQTGGNWWTLTPIASAPDYFQGLEYIVQANSSSSVGNPWAFRVVRVGGDNTAQNSLFINCAVYYSQIPPYATILTSNGSDVLANTVYAPVIAHEMGRAGAFNVSANVYVKGNLVANILSVSGNLIANSIVAGNLVQAAQFSGNVYAANVFGSLTNATLPTTQLTGTILPTNLPPTINADIFGNVTATGTVTTTGNVHATVLQASNVVSAALGSNTSSISVNAEAIFSGNVSINPGKVLDFGYAVQNTIISLYNETPGHLDPNNTNVYGFGVNSGALRYNSSAFANHIWYSNNFRLALLDYYGNYTVTNNVAANNVTAGNLVQAAQFSGNVYAANVFGSLVNATLPTTQLTGTVLPTNLPPTINADIFGNLTTTTGNVVAHNVVATNALFANNGVLLTSLSSSPGVNFNGAGDLGYANFNGAYSTNAGVGDLVLRSINANVIIQHGIGGAGLQISNVGTTVLNGGVLTMGFPIQNQVISMFGAINPSTTDYYGFGINPYTLRYQVPSIAQHAFYSSTTLMCNVTSTTGLWVTPYGPPSGSNYGSGLRVGNYSVTSGEKPINMTASLHLDTYPYYGCQTGGANGSLIKAVQFAQLDNVNYHTLFPSCLNSVTYFFWKSRGTNYTTSLSGSTFFTGQHANKPVDPDMKANVANYVGLIVSSADQGYYSINPTTGLTTTGSNAITISESLPFIKLTDQDMDPAIWGVVTNASNDQFIPETGLPLLDTSTDWGSRLGDRVRVNGLGEGAMWVANIAGNIANGDYICSSVIPGHGRKQADDLMHNYTVAKATMTCTFDLSNGSYVCEEYTWNGNTYTRAFIGVTYHCS